MALAEVHELVDEPCRRFRPIRHGAAVETAERAVRLHSEPAAARTFEDNIHPDVSAVARSGELLEVLVVIGIRIGVELREHLWRLTDPYDTVEAITHRQV